MIGVFGDEVKSVSVMEGHSVTLHTDVTHIQTHDEIQWRFKGIRIARIMRSYDINPTYDETEIFRDRVKMNNQTGDLTITHITSQHSGLYKLNILSGNTETDKRFNLTVNDADKHPIDQHDEDYENQIICSDSTFSKHNTQPVLMEIKAVNKCFQLETGNSLGVFRDLERLYMTTVRRILKPSVSRNHKQLRELDLIQSGIFLSPLDADLGTTFMDKLEESRLAPDMKERISSCCMDFLKELVKQYQLRLPASMEILSKLELFCPKSVMSTINRPGVKDLPADLFSCPIGTLETQWRNVATANFSDDQDIDKFWLEVEAFKDAGGHKCFQELAQGAKRSCSACFQCPC
ncbi:hypothetical protein E1301_Tti022041 [Triplophysa tibetana]|uniref:Immunoglobulin domain-containing protein n=1 Tax=Triplophysa tibetana TaxID=1572043 RepID=A0A5A9NQ19_9TELE|nr:hypothetical protein E1301_Tti022041 [Triplophysa tibetana]